MSLTADQPQCLLSKKRKKKINEVEDSSLDPDSSTEREKEMGGRREDGKYSNAFKRQMGQLT